MGFFDKWEDTPELTEEETRPTPQEITVKLTPSFIKLINHLNDIADKNGFSLTVAFPAQGIDLNYASPNYCFSVSNFETGDDFVNAEPIKKRLAKAVSDATSKFALNDYVYNRELFQLQKDHRLIQEEDVRSYISEANSIRKSIDGLIHDLMGEPPAKPVKKAEPSPAKKADIPHNTDVIDAVNKAMEAKKKTAAK